MTNLVQALAAVLLPSAAVFLLLLCNDKAILGPWTNPRWLNAVATLIVGILLALSLLLTATTVLPHIGVRAVAVALGAVLAAILAVLGGVSVRQSKTTPRFAGTPWERKTWTMPALETVSRSRPSRSRTIGLAVLRLYLMIAALLLIIKAIRLISG